MSRMIPGRIRNQGIELYEKGLVTITSTRDGVIQARITCNTPWKMTKLDVIVNFLPKKGIANIWLLWNIF